jgi:hypothetical protein
MVGHSMIVLSFIAFYSSANLRSVLV